jgi:sec-independent protein translocase protein TatC
MGTTDIEEDRMTVMEHLGELRNRLIKSALAVVAGAIVCWFAFGWIFDFLIEPYCDALQEVDSQQECQLILTNPLGGLSIRFTIAGYGGLALAMPVILWQIWRFIQPGLHSHERKYAIPFVFSGVALFFLGVAMAYWSLPRALDFLIEIGGPNLVAFFQPELYLSFVVKMMIAFGIGFQFPILLIFLQLAGILHNTTLRKGRRFAIVGIVILVAVVTPSGDPITLLALSIPMYLFYEISILFGIIRERRKRKALQKSSS